MWVLIIFLCYRSNQLSRQANMMSDFCYTNPTIVPGEELSRRGYSMYNGTDHTSGDGFGTKKDYGVYQEARSKFWRSIVGTHRDLVHVL